MNRDRQARNTVYEQVLRRDRDLVHRWRRPLGGGVPFEQRVCEHGGTHRTGSVHEPVRHGWAPDPRLRIEREGHSHDMQPPKLEPGVAAEHRGRSRHRLHGHVGVSGLRRVRSERPRWSIRVPGADVETSIEDRSATEAIECLAQTDRVLTAWWTRTSTVLRSNHQKPAAPPQDDDTPALDTASIWRPAGT